MAYMTFILAVSLNISALWATGPKSFCQIPSPSVDGQIILLSICYEHWICVSLCQHTLVLYFSFSLLFFLDRAALSSLEILSIMHTYLQTTWYRSHSTYLCWLITFVNDGWRSGVFSDSFGCVSCLQYCWPWTDLHSVWKQGQMGWVMELRVMCSFEPWNVLAVDWSRDHY